jgi:hypothetical protein|tara:strand:- start:845 stop:1174 length:330 start_codon:yes stop_codon:yes gene_type:complete
MDGMTFLKVHNIRPRIEKCGKKSNSCQDYVLERKLQRMIKNSIDDENVINSLIGKKGFGLTKKSVINNIKVVVNNKVQSLNGKEIRRYLKELQSIPISNCIEQIRAKYS